jgi:DNA-binding response OmpR family regulator
MMEPARILVVDDEAGIRFFLEEALAGDGHEVLAVDSGEAALERIAAETFDLALIDLRMKGIGGVEVLAALRRQSPGTAAIILTAHGSLETAVEALRQGAHDYLFKPCQLADLRASVRAALIKCRREQRQQELLAELERTLAHHLDEIRATTAAPSGVQSPAASPPPAGAAHPEVLAGLIVDGVRHTITLDGRPLDLSPTEFGLVAYLAGQAPRVVGPQELLREVQGYDCERYEARDIVRYHVHRIRQKARRCAGEGELIVTVRGVGYTLGVPSTTLPSFLEGE